jgi:hypothetical protein
MTNARGRLSVRTHQPLVTTEDTENTEGQTLVRRSPQGEEDQTIAIKLPLNPCCALPFKDSTGKVAAAERLYRDP